MNLPHQRHAGAAPLPAGVGAALLAAVLFSAGMPLAKALMGNVGPWMLAALLYLGSGLGLALLRALRRAPSARLERSKWPWLAGAVLAGGVVGPVLLMFGLSAMPAAGASPLLNDEGVFTALLAWFAFKENSYRRIAVGMLAIVAGAVVLSWPGQAQFGSVWPALAVLGAWLAWGIDNNLKRQVSVAETTWVAMVEGLAAGSVNLSIALTLGASLPPAGTVAAAAALGILASGIRRTHFVVALRHLGTARAGAYLSIAPFFGAVPAVMGLAEPLTPALLVAGVLMAVGVWLHLSERHEHEHTHEAMEHEHQHEHDLHHDHHAPGEVVPTRHTHRHRHLALAHTHPHIPDELHRHSH